MNRGSSICHSERDVFRRVKNLNHPDLSQPARTLGGACAAESNQVRYAIDKKHLHNCRNTFLLTVANWGNGYTKRDLTHNINFFMNVPVTPEGALTFEDGVSDKGRYVELQAEMDVICLISNCPQLNNPCNAYNPTPVRLLIWD